MQADEAWHSRDLGWRNVRFIKGGYLLVAKIKPCFMFDEIKECHIIVQCVEATMR